MTPDDRLFTNAMPSWPRILTRDLAAEYMDVTPDELDRLWQRNRIQGKFTHPIWGEAWDLYALSPMEEKRGRSFVYFIQTESGPIKIGHSKNPEERMRAMQTAHHEELTMLFQLSGGAWMEEQMHRRFYRSHLRGEWFKPTPMLVNSINAWKRIGHG